MKKLALALAVLLHSAAAQAALSAAIVWEIRTTGATTNGGGFKTGATGSDLTQQDAAAYSVTDGVANGTTTITSATANFGTNVVGNVMYVQGGTGAITAGWYEITARTNSTTITVDRSTGLTAGTGVTLKIGGALDNPARVASLSSGLGNDVWIKAGTYNITSAGANVETGRAQWSGASGNAMHIEGYQTTRGDRGTKPVMFATTLATGAMMESTGNVTLCNIESDSQNKAGVTPFAATAKTRYELCKAKNGNGTGFSLGSADRCIANTCGTGFSVSNAFGCVSESCTTVGFASGTNCIRCFDNASVKGFIVSSDGQFVINCVAYGGSNTGFDFGTTIGNQTAFNCVAVNRTGKGFTGVTGTNVMIVNCAGYNNSTGNHDATETWPVEGFIALTADPFVNAAAGNFTLNTTSGGGATLRGAGIPATFPTGVTSNSVDVGVSQATVASGGSSVFVN